MNFEGTKIVDTPLKAQRGAPVGKYFSGLQAPLVRTPLTDLMGNFVSAQEGNTFCANMEMLMLNCLDQYGYNRGTRMCGGYIQDLAECRTQQLEKIRILTMREERKRQYFAGKREKQFEECPPHH